MAAQTLSRIIISGGGTGGHVFPALAIADEVKRQFPHADILFVGALGRMEMEKVPQYGYPIEGLNISGINRSNLLKNLSLPGKLLSSVNKVRRILREHRPQAVVGVGGYASGPLLFLAIRQGIPALIQEQNSYPGVTNKLLARYAQKICVAYPGMEQFFSPEKVVFTGNPLRNFHAAGDGEKEAAYHSFGFSPEKPTLFLTGGSLGARTLNDAMLVMLPRLKEADVQVIWQTGKYYHQEMEAKAQSLKWPGLRIKAFVDNMPYAYAVSDFVISRAGAITLSELAVLGKPTILIPSPNVAEDHQTKNARVLADAHAALWVKETELPEGLWQAVEKLLKNPQERSVLKEKIKTFARPNAAKDIVEILKTIARPV